MVRIRVITLKQVILTALAALLVIALLIAVVRTIQSQGRQTFRSPPNVALGQISVARAESQGEDDEHRIDDSGADPAPLSFLSGIITPRTLLGQAVPVFNMLFKRAQAAPRGEYVLWRPSEVSEHIRYEISMIQDDKPPIAPIGDEGPRVLIYSTHAQEAYTKTAQQTYTEVSKQRTDDQHYSIVRIAAELAAALSGMNVPVLHDRTDHEAPGFNSAYNRSLETMLKQQQAHSSLQVFIDVHRDGYETPAGQDTALVFEGKRIARLLFVVGTGEGSTGSGFAQKPNWRENYKLALRITNELNDMVPGLCKPVAVRTGRYNQHVSENALLVEVGYNDNTLDEALNAIPYLAQAIGKALAQ